VKKKGEEKKTKRDEAASRAKSGRVSSRLAYPATARDGKSDESCEFSTGTGASSRLNAACFRRLAFFRCYLPSSLLPRFAPLPSPD